MTRWLEIPHEPLEPLLVLALHVLLPGQALLLVLVLVLGQLLVLLLLLLLLLQLLAPMLPVLPETIAPRHQHAEPLATT